MELQVHTVCVSFGMYLKYVYQHPLLGISLQLNPLNQSEISFLAVEGLNLLAYHGRAPEIK